MESSSEIPTQGKKKHRKMETPRSTRARRIRKAAMNKIRIPSGNEVLSFEVPSALRDDRLNSIHLPDVDNETIEPVSCPGDSEDSLSSNKYVDCNDLSKTGELRNWALRHNITHTALRDLLQLQHQWLPHDNFSTDPRTLLRTPRNVKVCKRAGGDYYYFGVMEYLTEVVENGLQQKVLPRIPK
jgi:hypothetical protein